MALLELKSIEKTYQKDRFEVKALRGVTFGVEKGEFLSVVGPSGSGKTTLLNIIGCLDTATAGSVTYDGRELSGMDEKALSRYRKENIGFIFQSYNLIPVLTVRENVELPLVIERKYSEVEIKKRAMETLGMVGLSGMADRFPREISGGQEQRVAIARALIKGPLLILADEPTANLDSDTANEIMDLMEKINRDSRATFVFSTHDPMVMARARRTLMLHDGAISKDERKGARA
jgi:putative ABC transport system ATP-binding protein